MAEIHKKYDGQWIFMINCSEDENGTITGGEVVLHNENRNTVFRNMEKYDYEKSLTYVRYAGKAPEGVSILL